MRPESKFWSSIKNKVDGNWTRLESPVSVGLPDCLCLVRGVTSLVELKAVASWGVEGLGTTVIQRYWMRRWCIGGGRAYLLAKVGDRVVLIWGGRLEKEMGSTWAGDNALAVWPAREIDFAELGYFMTTWDSRSSNGD